MAAGEFILGEFQRTLDDRFRLSVPAELQTQLQLNESGTAMLAKERPGCLSLWNAEVWQQKMDEGVDLIKAKMRTGRLQGELAQVQMFGRLLSTRHREVTVSERGRLLIPEGFREFLQIEAGGNVMVVGAAVCVEIWHPNAWLKYLHGRMPKFRRLFDKLSS